MADMASRRTSGHLLGTRFELDGQSRWALADGRPKQVVRLTHLVLVRPGWRWDPIRTKAVDTGRIFCLSGALKSGPVK